MKRLISSALVGAALGAILPFMVSAQSIELPLLQSGMLARAQSGDPKVYYIENETKRWIGSEATFLLHGFRWSSVAVVPDTQLARHTDGEPVTNKSYIVLPAETNTLPDLAPFAAKDVRLVVQGNRILLKFTAKFWNKGKGAFELITNPGTAAGDGDRLAFQRIFRPDRSYRDKAVGTIFWHQVHGHYHYDDFADYVLEMVRPAAGSTVVAPPVVNQKNTFCMRDDESVAMAPEGVRQGQTYTGCRENRQGVSIGWADVYPYTLPDQYFDVTGLPPGLYRLSFSVDPQQRFVESRRDNNDSTILVELNAAKRTVSIVASAAPFAAIDNHFPDGMLVRAQGDSKVYVIHQNKKRHLRTEEVFLSYGYSWGAIAVLPPSVLNAIPPDLLIRPRGETAVFALNDAGYRRRILDANILASYGWNAAAAAEVNATEFLSYPETDLVRRLGDDRVYSLRTRRSIGTMSSFLGLQSGYNPAAVHIVNQTEFNAYAVDVIAKDLTVPWDIVFLPDGDLLVTERPGTLRRIGARPASIAFPSILHVGEGGLMGLALHPNFKENSLVYVYFTTDENGKHNRISRFRLEGNALMEEKIIIDNIPAALFHDGGQIAFGPDGMLYITTGDAETPALSQDTGSLAGKTLRITADGEIPADNPFGNAVWSLGHRNAQGIAWDDRGRMWQTEHGRSGALSGFDELNLVEKGKNYGWPATQGDMTAAGMTAPVLHSGADVTWAPSGIAFAGGKLYFAGLRGSSLYEASLGEGATITDLRAHFGGVYGRLRAVVLGPDQFLYITTSNRDGRGTPRAGDDKILKVYPDFLHPSQ